MNKDTFKNKQHYQIEDLRMILALLRSPEGCPWDRAQTHQSVRRGVIEEAYEVAEAIDLDNDRMLTEELGDLLMQVFFHAQLGEEEGRFTFDDICDRICQKLIFRHPHVFSDSSDQSGSTEEGWQALKRQEKGQQTLQEELESIAKTLPALTRAEKIAGKRYRSDTDEQLLSMAEDQLHTLAKSQGDKRPQSLGALLFTLSRLAKRLKIDPEEALSRENERQTRK